MSGKDVQLQAAEQRYLCGSRRGTARSLCDPTKTGLDSDSGQWCMEPVEEGPKERGKGDWLGPKFCIEDCFWHGLLSSPSVCPKLFSSVPIVGQP